MATLELGSYVSYKNTPYLAIKSTGGANPMVTIIQAGDNKKLQVSSKNLLLMPYRAKEETLKCGKKTLVTLKGSRLSLVSHRWLVA